MAESGTLPEYVTLQVEDGVGTIRLDRPKMNAIDDQLQREIRVVALETAERSDVRAVVLYGGERVFAAGADIRQMAQLDGAGMAAWAPELTASFTAVATIPKPVIAAVNGMACGGAFYMLGEVEFILASDDAVFFDPHVTYGMTAAFEPIQMLSKMPFHEIMRMSLLGNHERMSAQRAHQIGLVSEVVPAGELLDAARWAAAAIASAPPVPVQATVRTLWAARELSRRQAIE
ncbi:MAG: enoyl-CoA hydratase/isomerase family protein, partial [Actinomycetota bacterium]|nr:enoyl-CoA hydratase/isomerase family protein [Actinomycetota bacterium]